MTCFIETCDESGQSHWINPARVLWITEFEVGASECRVVFGEHDFLDVAENAESLLAKLAPSQAIQEKP